MAIITILKTVIKFENSHEIFPMHKYMRNISTFIFDRTLIVLQSFKTDLS